MLFATELYGKPLIATTAADAARVSFKVAAVARGEVRAARVPPSAQVRGLDTFFAPLELLDSTTAGMGRGGRLRGSGRDGSGDGIAVVGGGGWEQAENDNAGAEAVVDPAFRLRVTIKYPTFLQDEP